MPERRSAPASGRIRSDEQAIQPAREEVSVQARQWTSASCSDQGALQLKHRRPNEHSVMSAKLATRTAESTFQGHRVELESYGGPVVASQAPGMLGQPKEPKPGAMRLPWQHVATDRVHQLLGQVAAKELQRQRPCEAPQWSGDGAHPVSKRMACGADQAGVLASLTVLSLECFDAALILAGELAADGALQP